MQTVNVRPSSVSQSTRQEGDSTGVPDSLSRVGMIPTRRGRSYLIGGQLRDRRRLSSSSRCEDDEPPAEDRLAVMTARELPQNNLVHTLGLDQYRLTGRAPGDHAIFPGSKREFEVFGGPAGWLLKDMEVY